LDFREILRLVLDWFLSSGITVILIIILALVALRLVRIIPKRVLATFKKKAEDSDEEKRLETLNSLLNYVLSATVLGIAIVMILGEFGIAIGPILAAAGIAGVAIGFGAQQLVQDIISGFFILIDDQIRVGDVIQIAGQGGLVERVNLRMTVLRDLAGNVHYIRNGQIGVVTNMTQDYSRFVFDIGVAYRENVDQVIHVIKKVDEELRNDPEYSDDILEPIEVLGLDQFGDSAIIIKARTKTKPIKQWRIGREFNRRLKTAFDENDIEIPFPHITLYMGQDKKGEAPPLNVQMGNEK
jgi:small-conductance mechanosensitive channel